MDEELLQRSDAPFGQVVWEQIDQAVCEAARSNLSARRLLETEGPYGLGLKSLPLGERPVEGNGEDEVLVTADRAVPVPLIATTFTLAARDIANFVRQGLPMDLGPAARAAAQCARKEDQLLFHGSEALGMHGLLTAQGVGSVNLREWKQPGDGVQDVMKALERIDSAGFHGPYTLALDPLRYTALLKRYPQGSTLEIEHMREVIGGQVIKAPAIQKGGVLVAQGRYLASIVLAQDLMTAFEGPAGRAYTFIVSESLALRLAEPTAVCRLQASGSRT